MRRASDVTILIGKTPVGPGHPCYVVAEIGINHNGDMGLARKAMDAARQAGAAAVKFQNYRTEDFIADRSLSYSYMSCGQEVTESQYDMFKRCELSDEDVLSLASYAREIGIDFHSTPTSAAGVRLLQKAGVCVLKNGSDFLEHLPLIKEMGRTGLPTVISTGMASAGAIEDAVSAFRETGNDQLILLHCVSRYPTPPAELNLNRMVALRDTFGCAVGFSDHSRGTTAAGIAVTLGAIWVEKHFTLSRDLPGPDHHFSSDPGELADLVEACRVADVALGSSTLASGTSEAKSKHDFTLSCVAARDLAAGHALEEADIGFRRPGRGLPPALAGKLVGRVLTRDAKAGRQFSFDDF